MGALVTLVKYSMVLVSMAAFLLIVRFFYLGHVSKKRVPKLGLVNGELYPCRSRHNCVCSAGEIELQNTATFKLRQDPMSSLEKLKGLILNLSGSQLIEDQGEYLHFTLTSRVFGFVDDLEIHFNAKKGAIDVRSASRVGQSDLGINLKRIKSLQTAYDSN